MTWFEELTGFREESPEQVRQKLVVEGNTIRSLVNGRIFVYGRLETPSLAELRQRVKTVAGTSRKLQLKQVVANVQHLHADAANAGAMFQVASQFNLLEMISPDVTPEQGIAIYEHDRTQGPACATAAGAGTIFRNYFVAVNGQTGQSAASQIDCLAELGAALGNADNRLWKMRNGYALPSSDALGKINALLQAANEAERDRLRSLLRIGIQWQTEVTLKNTGHTVSQAYCSALPVAYGNSAKHLWENFARLVLEASYEATICAAIVNAQETGNRKVFLTTLGGGAFGNDKKWLLEAMSRAFKLYRHHDLEIAIVSYGSADQDVKQFIEQFAAD